MVPRTLSVEFNQYCHLAMPLVGIEQPREFTHNASYKSDHTMMENCFLCVIDPLIVQTQKKTRTHSGRSDSVCLQLGQHIATTEYSREHEQCWQVESSEHYGQQISMLASPNLS